MARRSIRRWEHRPPPKAKRRRVERVILGAGMGVMAAVIERRIVKGLKKKGLDEVSLRVEGPHDATAEPSRG
jgi:hypothetical protein